MMDAMHAWLLHACAHAYMIDERGTNNNRGIRAQHAENNLIYSQKKQQAAAAN
jgi:hypothetical protein